MNAIRWILLAFLLPFSTAVSSSLAIGGGGNKTKGRERDGDVDSHERWRWRWRWRRGYNNHSRASPSSSSDSASCASLATCHSCNDASFCHWCDSDNSCHVMGSIHGCLSGSTCGGAPPPAPAPANDTSSCSSHKTCSECSLASHLCHWCGHDNACHAIGSLKGGCAVGVDCFSNERCLRRHPEPVRRIVFTQMGWIPFCAVASLTLAAWCCILSCWCAQAHVKGAYDDLAAAFVQGQRDSAATATPSSSSSPRPGSPSSPNRPRSRTTSTGDSIYHHHHEDNNNNEGVDDDADEEDGTRMIGGDGGSRRVVVGGGVITAANHVDEYVRLVDGSERDDSSDEAANHHPHHNNPTTTTTARSCSSLHLPHMARLYNACVLGNVVSLLLVASLATMSIVYYPKIPEYNICNDSVAWSSLIQSLTSLQATADFEILASVSNLNHYDILLDRGTRGTFSHNGVKVGTFDVPPVQATALSITDVLVVAHLAPEKWEALSLAAEYYRGVLVLDVDVTARIRIPALLGYATTVSLQGIEVQVNELSDRHLCACEDWDSARNHSSSTTAFLTAAHHFAPDPLVGGSVSGRAADANGGDDEANGSSVIQLEPTKEGANDAATGDEATVNSIVVQESKLEKQARGVSVEIM